MSKIMISKPLKNNHDIQTGTLQEKIFNLNQRFTELSVQKKQKSKSRCYKISFSRCALHAFNIVVLILGWAVISVAIWSIFWKNQFTSLLPTPIYVLVSYILLITGALTIFLAIFGLHSFQQKPMPHSYLLLLITISALELFVGGITYIYQTRVDDEVIQTLNVTFMNDYGIDDKRTNEIDLMQQTYRCCGAVSFDEWRNSLWLNSKSINLTLIRSNRNRIVPDSCCITYRENCGKSDHPSNIPYTGCVYKFIDEIRDHLNLLNVVSLGPFCFQLIGIFIAIFINCNEKPVKTAEFDLYRIH